VPGKENVVSLIRFGGDFYLNAPSIDAKSSGTRSL
jgi:hypothetical protein